MVRAIIRRSLALAILAAVGWDAGDARAHSHRQKGLEIVHPWCFAPEGEGVRTVLVYMLIKNGNKQPDRLIGATSPRAQSVELRATAALGSERRRPVAGVALKGRSEVALKRNGPHLIVSGLEQPLAPYDTFPMTLIFKRAGKIEVEVVVEQTAESGQE